MVSRSTPSSSTFSSTEHDSELLATAALHLATLYRPAIGAELLRCFGTARKVFEQRPPVLKDVAGITPSVLKRLFAEDTMRRAAEELRRVQDEGLFVIVRGTAGYPKILRDLPDMPLLLFGRGGRQLLDRGGLAIVGTRKPSPYGARQAQRFAGDCAAQGVSIVSGLARGVDGHAHRATLERGGQTLAVLGCGLGRVYPAEHRTLASDIVAAGGVVLSELPYLESPRAFHFPMRNRLISALADAVLVVEACQKSGSLITVRYALEQGRAVFAIPGRVDQPSARGCLELLRDGAQPALSPEDLLERLGIRRRGSTSEQGGDELEWLPGPYGVKLAELFAEEDTWNIDQIAVRLDIEITAAARELTRLEADGVVARQPGGEFVRT